MLATAERKIELRLFHGNTQMGIEIDIPASLGLMNDAKAKAPPFHGVMRVMTPKDGDKRVTWDSRDFTQIREAKEMFDKCVTQGLVPYRVGVGGKATCEVMSEFDPHAEEIIFLPIQAVVGG